MVLRLSEALMLPLEARNQLLTQAGFAPEYSDHRWSDTELAPIRQAVDRTLQNHLPYPRLAVDRMWRIVQTNKVAAAIYGQFGFGVGDSIIDLPLRDFMPEVIENWPEVAQAAANRLRVESTALGGVPEFDQASARLAQYGDSVDRVKSPVIPTIVSIGGQRISMFATIAQLGTPENVLLDDLKVELFFPMDDATAATFEAMGKM